MSTNPEAKGRRRAVVSLMVLPSEGISWMKIIPVWIASAVVNLAIVGLAALLFSFLGNVYADPWQDTDPVETTRILDQTNEEFDLTDDMFGMESGMPPDLKVDRLSDVIVAGGIVDPAQGDGLPDAKPDAAWRNVPLPLGSGPGLENGLLSLNPNLGVGEGGPLLNKPFSPRDPRAIPRMLVSEGGNKRSEASVAWGLKWLALHQANDGHWSLHDFHKYGREKPGGRIIGCNCEAGTTTRNDVAATGLGLLPFLGAGITHKPGKTTKKDYVKTVEGAVNWLMRNQSAKDGSYNGNMYAHGIATIAMCEAYGLTSDPRIKMSAQRALSFIAYAQDGNGGGWRYSPKQAGDTSVTGWQLMALKSGQMAGLSVPRNTLKLADRFLDSVEVPDKGSSMAGKTGEFGYTPGQPPTIAMTAVGLLCREYSGVGPKNPALEKGIQRLRTAPPGKNNSIYYLYYATQVMHHMHGENWRFWNEGVAADGKKAHNGMRDTLISRQDHGKTPRHPHQIGSWSGSQGGRLMATSLSILCLEVYYRHLPLYRRDIATKKN